MAAGPNLVKRVAEILGAQRIPVMPLKGVLLQRLVYGDKSYRPISDVDLLVPESRFLDAHAALRAAGFTQQQWEKGGWQVTVKDPTGPPLGVDLHRRLTRTSRSRLTAKGLFERGTIDTRIFGIAVTLPTANDLVAHLLLHATLHWLNCGNVHRPGDFQAVADSLRLDLQACAAHLRDQGLIPHALVMLPLIARASDGSFARDLLPRLGATPRSTVAAATVEALTARFAVGHAARRLAGLALAPSLSGALLSALLDRRAGPEGRR
jgi:hypothetical protein